MSQPDAMHLNRSGWTWSGIYRGMGS